MPQHLNARDFRQAAKRRLPKSLFEYIDRGAEDERALARLRESLDAIEMVPSVLTGHRERDLRTEILGREQAIPLIVAPTALAGLVSHQGEAKIARAASRLGIPVCVSTQSVTTVEEVAAGAPGADIWFQLYMWKDRRLSKALLERVAAAGVRNLVITADTPASPKREYNRRNGFSIPFEYSPRSVIDVAMHPRWFFGVLMRYLTTTGMPSYGHYPQEFRGAVTRPSIAEAVRLENLLNWEDVRQIRSWWQGKIVIKGVLSAADARKAREMEADAIVVSSHGARNLDVAPPPATILPRIVEAVGQDMEVLADSGVMRGSDVLKYIGLGAKAVMVGRLPLWGLAADGEAGADRLLSILRDEMDLTLCMLGLERPADCASAILSTERFSHGHH
ncbi:alpha-hydroxy acid oxidase [Agrobacterium tumefaciens]|uniref:alpha-hydroxy acid oxidase n=1 Tax=Agrobacterium tumefaciens TaxID=358 RepID=UPI0021CF68DE|nr:alpha-hydroxy acid oxidase [Agrobacterium tumefaciens]UXS03830.1 alpha-hydroxy-acid oxidizing protein [Agrobacterium tumefaciens]